MDSRFKQTVILVLLSAAVLVACSPAATPAPPVLPTQESYPLPEQPTPPGESSTQPEQPTPPGESYPQPEQPILPVYSPYPGPSEGVTNFIDWSQAEETILSGKVAKVYQAPTQHITLVLKDGSVALTTEPLLDEVTQVIERCGDPCKDIEKISQ